MLSEFEEIDQNRTCEGSVDGASGETRPSGAAEGVKAPHLPRFSENQDQGRQKAAVQPTKGAARDEDGFDQDIFFRGHAASSGGTKAAQ